MLEGWSLGTGVSGLHGGVESLQDTNWTVRFEVHVAVLRQTYGKVRMLGASPRQVPTAIACAGVPGV